MGSAVALIPKPGTRRWSRRQTMCSRTLRKITQLTQNTCSLRRYFTQNLRNNYANKITQIFPFYANRLCRYYTDITQILRKQITHSLRILRTVTQINYADITQINYAMFTHFTQILRK